MATVNHHLPATIHLPIFMKVFQDVDRFGHTNELEYCLRPGCLAFILMTSDDRTTYSSIIGEWPNVKL